MLHRSTARGALAAAALSLSLVGAPLGAQAAESVRIGFLATMTGLSANLGKDMLDGFNLGLKESGGKLGGLDVEVTVGDDQEKPDIGRQVADKLIESNKVDVLIGINNSTVLLAIAKSVLESGAILISTNAAPSQLAGKGCNQNLFVTSWQNDNSSEAMGKYVQDQGVKSVYLMAPNFPAGKDKLAGFKRFFKGQILGEVYTQYGQLDYASALAEARAAKPESLYFFYHGGMGINFVKQQDQAGMKNDMKVYSEMADLDESILPSVGAAAAGLQGAVFWGERMKNPANDRFVADYTKEYGRLPSPYAAQTYDAVRLLDVALRQAGGAKDKAALRKALLTAKFDSVRGFFAFDKNHFPIQDWYLAKPVKVGDHYEVETGQVILPHYGDAYADQCMLKEGE